MFQATDARQPVAVVSKILFQGNKVVSSRRESCIRNERSDETADLKEVAGGVPIEVEFFELEAVASSEHVFTSLGQ